MADHSWTGISLAIAPNIVAAVVVVVTAWQNGWQRRFSERAHQVDVRELKLALLERRLAVLSVVGGVLAETHVERGITDERNASLFAILLQGQTLFGRDIAERLRLAWLDQVAYHNARMNYLGAQRMPVPGSEADREAKRDEAERKRVALFEKLEKLHADMIAASRIDALLDDEPLLRRRNPPPQ